MTQFDVQWYATPRLEPGVLAVAIALVAVGSACGYVGSAQASSYGCHRASPSWCCSEIT